MQAAGGTRERGAGRSRVHTQQALGAHITQWDTPTHTHDLEGKHVEGAQSRTNKPTLERIGGKREREGEKGTGYKWYGSNSC